MCAVCLNHQPTAAAIPSVVLLALREVSLSAQVSLLAQGYDTKKRTLVSTAILGEQASDELVDASPRRVEGLSRNPEPGRAEL